MDSSRWQQIRTIFDHLVDKTPSHRRDYLDIVCEDDAGLRAEVERLLVINDELTRVEDQPFPADKIPMPASIHGYEIIEVLGQGGMGVVYRARDRGQRDVALKALPSFLIDNAQAKSRFEQEARALALLSHPALCSIYEVFTDQQPCIAMELCPGGPLSRMIADGRLSYRDSLRITIEVLQGLALVHEQKIYHRDIKPGNIIIAPDGAAKLIDFGIAKFANIKLTATGLILGSPDYMSPEQWKGSAVDQRSDLWSIGIILYEMLVGKPPFPADNREQKALAVLNDAAEPLPAVIDGYGTSGIQAIINRLLAKSPDQRYQNAGELLQALLDLE